MFLRGLLYRISPFFRIKKTSSELFNFDHVEFSGNAHFDVYLKTLPSSIFTIFEHIQPPLGTLAANHSVRSLFIHVSYPMLFVYNDV